MQANGDAIRAIRERTGLTIAALAREAQVERTHLNRIERGERAGTPAQLRQIAVALKVPTTAIINGPTEAVA